MKQEDVVEPPSFLLLKVGRWASFNDQGVWMVLCEASSWFLRPPDQSLRSVIWMSEEPPHHHLTPLWNQLPDQVLEADHTFQFFHSGFQLGIFQAEAPKVGFPTQKVRWSAFKDGRPVCVKHLQAVVTFHLWAPLTRLCHNQVPRIRNIAQHIWMLWTMEANKGWTTRAFVDAAILFSNRQLGCDVTGSRILSPAWRFGFNLLLEIIFIIFYSCPFCPPRML